MVEQNKFQYEIWHGSTSSAKDRLVDITMVANRMCLSDFQLLETLKEAEVSESLEVVLWNPHYCLAGGLLSSCFLPMTEHGQDTEAGMQFLRDETPLMSNYGLRTNQLPCLTTLRTAWQ